MSSRRVCKLLRGQDRPLTQESLIASGRSWERKGSGLCGRELEVCVYSCMQRSSVSQMVLCWTVSLSFLQLVCAGPLLSLVWLWWLMSSYSGGSTLTLGDSKSIFFCLKELFSPFSPFWSNLGSCKADREGGWGSMWGCTLGIHGRYGNTEHSASEAGNKTPQLDAIFFFPFLLNFC